MSTRLRAFAAVASSAVLAGLSIAAPAAAFTDIPLYSYTYYGDATYTAVVGYENGACYNGYAGVQPLVGTSSSYVVQEQIGVCRGPLTIYW